MKKLLLLEKKDREEGALIIAAGRARGVEVEHLDLDDFRFELGALDALERQIEGYDGLWARTYADFSLVRILCSLFERRGKPVFGASSHDPLFIQDKMADLWTLSAAGVPIPRTASSALAPGPVIHKPYWGFGGFGIHAVDPQKPYHYQQELISKSSDLRVYVSIWGAIPLAIERSNALDFRTNKHQGGSFAVFSFERYAQLHGESALALLSQTAEQAARALRRPFCAVDLIHNDGLLQVLEVNRTPRVRLTPEANELVIGTMARDIAARLRE